MVGNSGLTPRGYIQFIMYMERDFINQFILKKGVVGGYRKQYRTNGFSNMDMDITNMFSGKRRKPENLD